MNSQGIVKALAAVAAYGLVLIVGCAFVAEVTTTMICGARPVPQHFLSGILVAITGDPTYYTFPEACPFPEWQIRLLDALIVVPLLASAIAITVGLRRYRNSDRAFIADLRTRPGFASASEVKKFMSDRAVLRRARQLRPDIIRPRPADVGWRVGRSRGHEVFVSIEDSVALEGPPRSGKGYRVLISAILDWSGPLVTTSTTNDNLTATLRLRQKRGDVYVFDPQGLSGIRDSLRLSPIAGCENPLTAMQRGNAIITGTALGSSSTNGEWAQASGVVLGRLLHAAAVGERTIEDVYDWGSSPALARTAVDVLRSDGAPGWGDSLDATINADEKLVSSIWFGVQGAVAPLAVPQIRDALMPRPGARVFDPTEFLDGANTLYLIGSSSGASAMGGFLGALLDDIVEVARTRALASPGSRLPHPLGLILDEIANMFRWDALPRTMADGGGRGICTFVVLQALSQAETAWSRAEADTIWGAATAKVLLGGASHVAHLRDIETLLGSRQSYRTERSWNSEHRGQQVSERQDRLPLMSVDEIRRMPETLGLLAYRNRRGVLLDLAGWDERHDAREIQGTKRALEDEQRRYFAAARTSSPIASTAIEPESDSGREDPASTDTRGEA